jgi:hypothetical protein
MQTLSRIQNSCARNSLKQVPQLDEFENRRSGSEMRRKNSHKPSKKKSQAENEKQIEAWSDLFPLVKSGDETLLNNLIIFGLVFDGQRSPEHIRSDNCAEFTAKAVRTWRSRLGVKTLYIDPGGTWEK